MEDSFKDLKGDRGVNLNLKTDVDVRWSRMVILNEFCNMNKCSTDKVVLPVPAITGKSGMEITDTSNGTHDHEYKTQTGNQISVVSNFQNYPKPGKVSGKKSVAETLIEQAEKEKTLLPLMKEVQLPETNLILPDQVESHAQKRCQEDFIIDSLNYKCTLDNDIGRCSLIEAHTEVFRTCHRNRNRYHTCTSSGINKCSIKTREEKKRIQSDLDEWLSCVVDFFVSPRHKSRSIYSDRPLFTSEFCDVAGMRNEKVSQKELIKHRTRAGFRSLQLMASDCQMDQEYSFRLMAASTLEGLDARINSATPKHLGYQYTKLHSYPTFKLKPEELADAGFVYTGDRGANLNSKADVDVRCRRKAILNGQRSNKNKRSTDKVDLPLHAIEFKCDMGTCTHTSNCRHGLRYRPYVQQAGKPIGVVSKASDYQNYQKLGKVSGKKSVAEKLIERVEATCCESSCATEMEATELSLMKEVQFPENNLILPDHVESPTERSKVVMHSWDETSIIRLQLLEHVTTLVEIVLSLYKDLSMLDNRDSPTKIQGTDHNGIAGMRDNDDHRKHELLELLAGGFIPTCRRAIGKQEWNVKTVELVREILCSFALNWIENLFSELIRSTGYTDQPLQITYILGIQCGARKTEVPTLQTVQLIGQNMTLEEKRWEHFLHDVDLTRSFLFKNWPKPRYDSNTATFMFEFILHKNITVLKQIQSNGTARKELEVATYLEESNNLNPAVVDSSFSGTNLTDHDTKGENLIQRSEESQTSSGEISGLLCQCWSPSLLLMIGMLLVFCSTTASCASMEKTTLVSEAECVSLTSASLSYGLMTKPRKMTRHLELQHVYFDDAHNGEHVFFFEMSQMVFLVLVIIFVVQMLRFVTRDTRQPNREGLDNNAPLHERYGVQETEDPNRPRLPDPNLPRTVCIQSYSLQWNILPRRYMYEEMITLRKENERQKKDLAEKEEERKRSTKCAIGWRNGHTPWIHILQRRTLR